MWRDAEKAVEAAISASRELTAAALASTTLAIHKAETATEKRFESVNEFRGQMSDQQRTLMPRAEFDAVMAGVRSKLTVVETALVEMRSTKEGAIKGWGWVVGVIGFMALAYSFLK